MPHLSTIRILFNKHLRGVLALSLLLSTGVVLHAQVPVKKKSVVEQDYEALQKRINKRNKKLAETQKLIEQYGGGSSSAIMHYEVVDGDTIYLDQITPVYSFGYLKKNYNSKSWKQYRRLVYNFAQVYPYALQARVIIREADSVLAVSNFSDREREAYIDAYQKKLFSEFEKPLRKMTISQGRLLLKLIDRELGRTSFYIIREYRGKLSAGFWQTVARVFGNNLKKPYDRFGEDRPVEDLVTLWQDGAFGYFYASMFGTLPDAPFIKP